jgi:hypothetical protein|tara:strand:+ start:1652 stop:1999 length:348 start_codon:yes stop_codon:yes gene_type:complete
MANRNRRAGHSWERECVKILIEFFPDVVTSRAESRNRDDQKVDLCYTGFLNVQCKTLKDRVNYVEVLSEMPDEEGQMNVIFDKKTRKTPKGRFVTEGIYVHLKLEDFVELIRKSC